MCTILVCVYSFKCNTTLFGGGASTPVLEGGECFSSPPEMTHWLGLGCGKRVGV